jgi:hypothetical protein
MSSLGVFVRTPTCPPIAVSVQMEIILPTIEPGRNPLRVLSKGRVLRVEQPSANEAQSGFAVVLKPCDLHLVQRN